MSGAFGEDWAAAGWFVRSLSLLWPHIVLHSRIKGCTVDGKKIPLLIGPFKSAVDCKERCLEVDNTSVQAWLATYGTLYSMNRLFRAILNSII